VVIPTRDRVSLLERCLAALRRQTADPADFEVVAVDDGSTDGTRELLATFDAPWHLRVCHQNSSGQAAALNAGIEAARGRYCVFLDDDVTAEPELVREHLSAQRAGGGVIGLGQLSVSLSPDADWFARAHAEAFHARYRALNGGARVPSWRDCVSGNLSAPRAALLEVRGFDVELPRSYDVELGHRLEAHGLRYVYVPAAHATERFSKGVDALIRDAEKAGAAALALYRLHPEMLPLLEIGGRGDPGVLAVLLRRAIAQHELPATVFDALGRALRHDAARQRWYRFVFGCAYWRGVRDAVGDRETWRALHHWPVILMYHAVDPAGGASRYVVPAARLARHLAWLRRRGFVPLALDALLEAKREHRLPPPRSIVVTFDDGYVDVATIAEPILRRYGFPATVFLVSTAMGAPMQWDDESELTGRAIMSYPMARDLRRSGVAFGAHSRTHPRLTRVPREVVEHEVVDSRSELEAELGVPVTTFSYPYGKHDATVRSIVERAGFSGACGLEPGPNTAAVPRFALRRIDVYGTDSVLRFAVSVWLGRRWTFVKPLRERAAALRGVFAVILLPAQKS
jgi:peptidoglycan/xylan/chitin deacetylase (PgdA/CDA1 family)